jgi:hypothetical protein
MIISYFLLSTKNIQIKWQVISYYFCEDCCILGHLRELKFRVKFSIHM